jgi:LacI family transcriptional regulator
VLHQNKIKEIALAFPASVPWMALCYQGIAEYARQVGNWRLVTSPPTLAGTDEHVLTLAALRDWPGDGVIAGVHDPAEARAAGRLTIPVVNLSGGLRRCQLPRVMVDQAAVGRLAAEHFLERRLRRLAYCGLSGPWYSHERQIAFVARASEAGVPCDVFEMPRLPARCTWRYHADWLADCLKKIATPIGILAVHDYRARMLLDACLRLGLNVPHDVAVLGVDNDSTVCESCSPTLSSVSRNSWQVGYQAAAMLDRLMADHSAPTCEILIPPDGVIARQSTDTIHAADPHVRDSIQYMQSHLGEAFGIGQVLEHIAISRRLLEKRFRQCLDCTPYEFLRIMRIRRAKQLLASPQKQKLRGLATACGFTSDKRLRIAFKRAENMTPCEYRWLRRHAKLESNADS